MIKVKLLTENARLPTRNNSTDAGLDIYSNETTLIKAKKWSPISIGIAISIPDGYYARIAPRSGLALKYGLDVFAGVIDSGYRGEIKVILYNAGEKDYLVNDGDKIAQMIIEKCYIWNTELVENLDDSERKENGFGSSGQ